MWQFIGRQISWGAFPLSMLLIGANIAYIENWIEEIPFLDLMISRSMIGIFCSILALISGGNFRLLRSPSFSLSDVKSSFLKATFGILAFNFFLYKGLLSANALTANLTTAATPTLGILINLIFFKCHHLSLALSASFLASLSIFVALSSKLGPAGSLQLTALLYLTACSLSEVIYVYICKYLKVKKSGGEQMLEVFWMNLISFSCCLAAKIYQNGSHLHFIFNTEIAVYGLIAGFIVTYLQITGAERISNMQLMLCLGLVPLGGVLYHCITQAQLPEGFEILSTLLMMASLLIARQISFSPATQLSK